MVGQYKGVYISTKEGRKAGLGREKACYPWISWQY